MRFPSFKNSEELRSIAADMPKERGLGETDAPFLAPMPNRGKTNEPSFTVHTAQVLAEVWGEPVEKVWAQTTENFFSLFSKVPRELAGDASIGKAA